MSKELDDIIRGLDEPIQMPPTDAIIGMLRDQAAEFGFALTGRCQHCMRPITAPRSLKARSGPVCAAKHKEEEPDGTTPDLHTADR